MSYIPNAPWSVMGDSYFNEALPLTIIDADGNPIAAVASSSDDQTIAFTPDDLHIANLISIAPELAAAARDMLVVWEGAAHPTLAYRKGSPAQILRDLLATLDTCAAPSTVDEGKAMSQLHSPAQHPAGVIRYGAVKISHQGRDPGSLG